MDPTQYVDDPSSGISDFGVLSIEEGTNLHWNILLNSLLPNCPSASRINQTYKSICYCISYRVWLLRGIYVWNIVQHKIKTQWWGQLVLIGILTRFERQ